MLPRFLILCILLVWDNPVTAGVPARVRRHPISVTEAGMFVTRDRAVTRIRIFAEDLVLFQGLEPDDQDRILPDDLRRGLQDHREFLLEKFILRDAAGELISGTVTDLKPFEIPVDGIPSTEMMKHTAEYQIEHEFGETPQFLTIQQDIADANFIIPSEMTLTVHQSGTGLNWTERLQPGNSTTIRFDWDNTLSEDATDEQWDQWFQKQREQTLGITSYSSLYSFIYLDRTEVRHEVLIPLATLGTILPLRHADPAFIDVAEQDVIREQISEWLSEENPVLINGQQVRPQFPRIDFYSLNLSDFASRPEAQPVSLASGRVGVIMTYPAADDFVRTASVSWTRFYSAVTRIPAIVVPPVGELQRFEFSRFHEPEKNVFAWECPEEILPQLPAELPATVPPRPQLRISIVSIICLLLVLPAFGFISAPRSRAAVLAGIVIVAGGSWKMNLAAVGVEHPLRAPPQIADDEAGKILTHLHGSMYRSLSFGGESRIYDALAAGVDGPLLEDLYLQLMESLRIREQGGAIARVEQVQLDPPQRTGSTGTDASVMWPGFQCEASWVVAGTVEHWGHIHERQNRFDAVFSVEPRDGHWKITAMDIRGQEQKSARTRLRSF